MTCNRERLNERIFALLNLTAALRQKAIHQLDQAPRRSPAISEGDFRESTTSRMRITCWLLDVFDKRYVRLRNITETLGHVFGGRKLYAIFTNMNRACSGIWQTNFTAWCIRRSMQKRIQAKREDGYTWSFDFQVFSCVMNNIHHQFWTHPTIILPVRVPEAVEL